MSMDKQATTKRIFFGSRCTVIQSHTNHKTTNEYSNILFYYNASVFLIDNMISYSSYTVTTENEQYSAFSAHARAQAENKMLRG